MHPEAHRGFATGPLALCDLIFMMREGQIHTTCMNIELLTEVFGCHCRALDMPTREPDAPWTRPVHLSRFITMFPEREIFRCILIFSNLHLLTPMSTCTQVLNGIA